MTNSKQKGNRSEREVVKLCKQYWQSNDFMKSPESGALSTMLEGFGAPADIIGRLAGDLLVPVDFPFCIESKFYKEINLWSLFTNPANNYIKQWWEQCVNDAKRAKKIPLLTIKQNYGKRYVVLAEDDINHLDPIEKPAGYIKTELGETAVWMLLWNDFIRMFPKQHIINASSLSLEE